MRRFVDLVVANTKITFRNWQSLFWMLAFPIIIMTMLGIVFGGGGTTKVKLGLTDYDRSKVSESVVNAFEKIDSFIVYRGARKTELNKLKDGKLDAVIVIEKGFGSAVSGQLERRQKQIISKLLISQNPLLKADNIKVQKARIKLYYDPAQTFTSQMVRSTIRSIIAGMEKQMSQTPSLIAVTEKRQAAAGLDFIDFLLPGIIGMSIMSTGIFGLSTVMVSYREQGILRRLKITPLPLSYFIGSQVVVSVIRALIQTVVLILFAKVCFGVQIIGNLFYLAVTVMVGAICFITIGFLVASFSNRVETADTIGNIITMPMMFLSGIFFPIENAPKWIQPIIKMLPLKFLADALRDIAVKGKSLDQVAINLYILLAITAVVFIMVLKLFRWEVKAS
ncbi:MAG: ABC transporter permease [Actinobacteria bacterium]|nr:MAG: ABC transporter permease [Actinomycetota bacterium]